MVPDVSAGPDPTVLYYLRAQATLNLGFGALVLLSGAVPAIYHLGKSKLRGWPWLVVGVTVGVLCLYYAVRELDVATPRLALAGDVLRVGDDEVRLDDSTTIDHLGDPDALRIPTPDRKGIRAMPNAWDLPPRFAGGPRVVVRTRAGEVSFQPLLYGPGAYMTVGQPDATALIQRLLGYGEGGNARAWLRAAFSPVAGPPPAPPSFRSFLITFLVIAVPVLTFLVVAAAVALKQRLSR
jgi:hypothetical protein